MRFLPIAAIVLLLPACEPRREPAAVSTRDSAGVQIVSPRLDDADAGEAWRVSDTPTVDIGSGATQAGSLYQVVSTFRMSDGRIVVASAGTGELRIHGADGRLVRTVGRKGEGPGEFGRLLWAGRWRGDSIAAWDAQLARLTVFDTDGTFARTLVPRAQLGMFPRAQGVLADGSVVLASGMEPSRGMSMATGVRRDTMTLVVVGPDGGVRDTLGRFPGSEQYLMVPPGGGFVIHPLPFGRATAAAAQGTQIAIGSGDAYEVALYQAGRGLRRLIRGGRERRRVTDEDVRRYRETLVAMGAEGDPFARRRQEQFLREVPFPDRMPALTAILPDGRGNWWIQDPPAESASAGTRWSLLSPDGRLLGTLRAPAGLTLQEIGPDWVLGIALDDDDAEHVRIHPLRR